MSHSIFLAVTRYHPHNEFSAGTIKAYFRGNGVNVVKIAPETALRLTLNDRIKAVVAKNHLERITPIERMACGGLAGASAQVILPRPQMQLLCCKNRALFP